MTAASVMRAGIGTSPVKAAEQVALAPTETQRQLFVASLRAHRPAWISLWTLTALTLACIVLPPVLPWTSTEIDISNISATAPSLHHVLGTDALGRDVLARLLSAGRISLLIGFMVALFSAGAGASVGVAAGYFGGRADSLLMWLVDVLLTIPSLPIMIALSTVAASEGSTASSIFRAVPPQWRIIIIMSLLGWMGISRVVRSQVISLRKQEFVEAAIALGATHRRVMLVHILPNTVSVLAVFTTLAVSGAIMGESALSFLGVGVSPPTATWGNMLGEGRDAFTAVQYWWLTWSPAAVILLTVLCVNFIGDGMRAAFDPKARR